MTALDQAFIKAFTQQHISAGGVAAIGYAGAEAGALPATNTRRGKRAASRPRAASRQWQHARNETREQASVLLAVLVSPSAPIVKPSTVLESPGSRMPSRHRHRQRSTRYGPRWKNRPRRWPASLKSGGARSEGDANSEDGTRKANAECRRRSTSLPRVPTFNVSIRRIPNRQPPSPFFPLLPFPFASSPAPPMLPRANSSRRGRWTISPGRESVDG